MLLKEVWWTYNTKGNRLRRCIEESLARVILLFLHSINMCVQRNLLKLFDQHIPLVNFPLLFYSLHQCCKGTFYFSVKLNDNENDILSLVYLMIFTAVLINFIVFMNIYWNYVLCLKNFYFRIEINLLMLKVHIW